MTKKYHHNLGLISAITLLIAANQPATTANAAESAGGSASSAAPQEMSADDTAKQLANPNTPLASLTLKTQFTRWDGTLFGAHNLDSQTFLFQPSFPFPVSKTGTIFLRPAFPYLLDQPVVDKLGRVGTKSGFGDMGLDFAYGHTSKSGVLTAVGMVAGIPIGEDGLSSETWTLGPELFVGKLSKTHVIGVLTTHQWDVSGPRETSLTSIQPILTFLPGNGWAIGTGGTMTYNWKAEQWTIPLQMQVSKTVKIGKMPLKIAVEGNYYIEKPDALGQEWMVGINLTPVVPNVVAKWLGGN